MLTRRLIILTAIGSVIAFPALADDTAALALMKGIYTAYRGKNAKGIAIDDAAALRRYFTPSLAALMINDQKAAARRNEPPKLDGDPFVDAQDWDIPDFDIAITGTAPGKATATVKFVNQGEAKSVMLSLVKLANNWHVDDITWIHDGKPESLRGILAH